VRGRGALGWDLADTLGLSIAIGSVGLLTFLSGVIVAFAMREKRQP